MQFLQTPNQANSPSKCQCILAGQAGSQITLVTLPILMQRHSQKTSSAIKIVVLGPIEASIATIFKCHWWSQTKEDLLNPLCLSKKLIWKHVIWNQILYNKETCNRAEFLSSLRQHSWYVVSMIILTWACLLIKGGPSANVCI